MGDYEEDPSWELSEEEFSDELEDEFSQEDLANTSQGKMTLETCSGRISNSDRNIFENVIRVVLQTVRNCDKQH